MGKGGKYLAKKPVAKKKKKSILSKILIGILIVLLLLIGGVVLYINHLMNLVSRPDNVVTRPTETIAASVSTEAVPATDAEETTAGTTSPEDTWPVVVSDENITNFMLVGQAAREGEEHLISDTMILVSINRETKTLTLTSLMRDLRLVWPRYVDTLGREHSGNNRINMAYNMGYSWTKNKQDSMDVLESIVQHNFGIPVERTVEIDFDIFMKVVDLLGDVTIYIDEAELKYLQENYNWMDTLTVGENRVGGYKALCYARMRKVGHGDYDRTERQREVITSLLNNLKGMNILEIHKLFTEILPMITTDMSNAEIMNYAWEFIPMLKDLKIQSQRLPYEGNEGYIEVIIDGRPDGQLTIPDIKAAAKWLQESIGMTSADAMTEE